MTELEKIANRSWEEMETFCSNVKTLRKNKNLNILEFAREININKSTLAGMEHGKNVTLKNVFKVADFFYVSISDLFSKKFELETINSSKYQNVKKHYKSCGRFSVSKIEKTPEEIEAIKQKYKNGITPAIMAEFEETLKSWGL